LSFYLIVVAKILYCGEMKVKKAENEFAGHKELLGGPQVEYLCSTELSPNVVVEWSTTQLRIWEIPGSNLCPETGYPG
jgi:hypothetical protein